MEKKKVVSKVPKVSIMIPMYNAERFVGETIESILSQSFGDFELLICDDGSTDGSVDVVRSFGDPRIKLIRNEENMRSARTRNKMVELACGEYGVSFDADDLFAQDRLARQVEFLDSHPEVDFYTGAYAYITEDGELMGKLLHANDSNHEQVKITAMIGTPVTHVSGMFRLAKYRQHGLGYKPELCNAEDFSMLKDAIEVMRFQNSSEVAGYYRQHSGQMTTLAYDKQTREAADILAELHARMGVVAQEGDRDLLFSLVRIDFPRKVLPLYRKYVLRMLEANRVSCRHDQQALIDTLLHRYRRGSQKSRSGLGKYMIYPRYWAFARNVKKLYGRG